MYDRPPTKSEGKEIFWKERRQVDIDYIDLSEAIIRLQKAGEGLDKCTVEVEHENWGYEGCSTRVFVEGWRPATDEERAELRTWEAKQKANRQQQVAAQVEALRKAGYRVEKT